MFCECFNAPTDVGRWAASLIKPTLWRAYLRHIEYDPES